MFYIWVMYLLINKCKPNWEINGSQIYESHLSVINMFFYIIWYIRKKYYFENILYNLCKCYGVMSVRRGEGGNGGRHIERWGGHNKYEISLN